MINGETGRFASRLNNKFMAGIFTVAEKIETYLFGNGCKEVLKTHTVKLPKGKRLATVEESLKYDSYHHLTSRDKVITLKNKRGSITGYNPQTGKRTFRVRFDNKIKDNPTRSMIEFDGKQYMVTSFTRFNAKGLPLR